MERYPDLVVMLWHLLIILQAQQLLMNEGRGCFLCFVGVLCFLCDILPHLCNEKNGAKTACDAVELGAGELRNKPPYTTAGGR